MENQEKGLTRAVYEAPSIQRFTVEVELGFCQSTEVGPDKEEFKQEVNNERWEEESEWL